MYSFVITSTAANNSHLHIIFYFVYLHIILLLTPATADCQLSYNYVLQIRSEKGETLLVKSSRTVIREETKFKVDIHVAEYRSVHSNLS